MLQIDSRSGRPASSPTWAIFPGLRKSAEDRLVPEAFRPKPAKLSKMIRARVFQLLMRNAKTPTKSVFLTRRARMSSSAPQAQNRPANVMSIAASVLARYPTSPPSSPNPESM